MGDEMKGNIVVYRSADGKVKLDVRLQNETLWMTQNAMAELFQCSTDNISLHIKNIYSEGELNETATTEDFSVVRQEGNREVKRTLTHYNLDVIISVGYRIKSIIATNFRIWATQTLKEYIIKGFVLDDERLKNPAIQDDDRSDYFNELLERIRDIRASEKRMYLRVREIFSMAADYNPNHEDTLMFFRIIQNKLHYASSGMTAAELIKSRVNHELPNMGLTSWKGDEIRKADVTIAKNYLKEEEITELNRIVTMWLDYAEDQARRRKRVFMKDWEDKLDNFLRFNERTVLPDAGTVRKDDADTLAKDEYERYARKRRKIMEDLGEKDYLNQLEEAAKIIPPSGNEGKA